MLRGGRGRGREGDEGEPAKVAGSSSGGGMCTQRPSPAAASPRPPTASYTTTFSVCLLKAHQSLFAGSCPSHYSSFAGGPSEIFYFAGRMKDIQFPPGIKENEAKYLVSSQRDFLDSVCPLCRRRETVALLVGGVTSLSLSLAAVITFYLEPPPPLSPSSFPHSSAALLV